MSGRKRRLGQHTLSEERKSCSAIHLALEQLESIDLPFDRPLTPGIAQSGAYRRVITAQALRKAHKLGDTGVLALLQPAVEACGRPLSDEGMKRRQQALRLSHRRTQLLERGQVLGFVNRESCLRLGEEPARLAHRVRDGFLLR